MVSILKSLLLVGIAVFLSVPAVAQDGKTLYSTSFCSTCHGLSGTALVPNYPSLKGQNAQYMNAQVKDIISGVRKSNLTILMTNNPNIKTISETNINSITEYIAKP